VSTRSRGRSVGLDDLIALNDEIAALSRAGLPLERGLLGFGDEAAGRLGRLSRSIGGRMAEGETLEGALRAEGDALPATYRAVVEAGLRSGRLAAALEGLAESARGFAELRRAVGLAFLYPLMVLCLGYALFVGFVVALLPRLAGAFRSFGLPTSGAVEALAGLGASAWIWGPIVPALVAALVLAWYASGRARALGVDRGLGWVPWLRATLADWRASNLAGWLALLVEHGVPLADAVELASAATGDASLDAAGRAIAAAARRGEPIDAAARAGGSPGPGGLPPLLRWMIVAGAGRGELAPALRHAAETYRLRALRRAEALSATLPSVLLLLIGGSAAALYALALFAPWTGLLESLSRPRP
jgi:general secretion pathway protein F